MLNGICKRLIFGIFFLFVVVTAFAQQNGTLHLVEARYPQLVMHPEAKLGDDRQTIPAEGNKWRVVAEESDFYRLSVSGKYAYVLKSDVQDVQSEEPAALPAPTETVAESLPTDAELMAEPGKQPIPDHGELPMRKLTVGKKTFNVADIYDVRHVYKEDARKENCFVVVSKREFRLYVYEVTGKDTVLVAHYPVCYAKYPEGKTKQGDMRTPDCSMDAPFTISQIQDASTWKHDFKDGRGNMKAYGDWFIRLNLSKSKNTPSVKANRSIGIHGSSGNRESVPGRDSEGCIRLRDEDISHFKSHFAFVGEKVVVKPYQQEKLPFELKAEKALGNKYQHAVLGYRLFK